MGQMLASGVACLRRAGQTFTMKNDPGAPSLFPEDLKTGMMNTSGQRGRFTLDEIHEKFPQISRSLIHKIVTEYLHYKKKKIYARWVPRVFTEGPKNNCICAAMMFLVLYDKNRDNFGGQIVTGYAAWVSHIIPESKHQSMEWYHSHSPSNPIKFK
jgi:hypothetical protein